MRKLILIAAALCMLSITGLAVARGLNDSKSVTAVTGTFTATTVGDSQTRSCTTADGKAITSTSATYTGTSTGAADLTGAATLQVHSTINTTDGVGVVTGRLKIAASGGDTVGHFDAVYDHGNIAGAVSGHAAAPHVSLLGNVSAGFSATGGLTAGKIGGGTTGGSAVELGSGKCDSTKTVNERSEAHGTVSAVSSTSITVAGLTCAVPTDLAAKVAAVKVNDRAAIKCSLISGVNTLTLVSGKS
ncbi:MAG TPA: hypothetical protein VNY33_01970 [Gaiellaceae bacterium]|jgi:hypothetical protein|nr:hypothetical protein [Gaiellaceae bacterium]